MNPPSVQDLLAADSHAVPAPLLDDSWLDQGLGGIPRSRYTSAEFAALENEFLWTRTWQFACLEAEIADPGDYVVYDVADQSLLVTRGPDGSVKAFHNSCLHRGTKLRDDDGRAKSFRCPFHGWRWDLEGTLVELPANWDVPQVWEDPVASCLPEALVAVWAGFVFVNMDLEGPMPEPAETTVLPPEADWHEAPGMGGLAAVFEQDMANLPKVQAGLKSQGKRTVSFARYQEGRFRHMHRLMDRHIEAGLVADGRDPAVLDPHCA